MKAIGYRRNLPVDQPLALEDLTRDAIIPLTSQRLRSLFSRRTFSVTIATLPSWTRLPPSSTSGTEGRDTPSGA